MHFDIVPMRLLGKPVDQKQLRAAVPIRGDVHIRMENQSPMGRPSLIAEVLNTGCGPDALPHLYDVQVNGMSTLGATITGVELIDGVAYAQSWWIRVP